MVPACLSPIWPACRCPSSQIPKEVPPPGPELCTICQPQAPTPAAPVSSELFLVRQAGFGWRRGRLQIPAFSFFCFLEKPRVTRGKYQYLSWSCAFLPRTFGIVGRSNCSSSKPTDFLFQHAHGRWSHHLPAVSSSIYHSKNM